MIFFMFARTLHVSIFTMKLCHDFTINLLRKSREINCLTISKYYPVSYNANIRIYPLSGQ